MPVLNCTLIRREAVDLFRIGSASDCMQSGQIEGLFLLRRGVTEMLIAEGFESVRGAHSALKIGDDTLKGLLEGQREALEMMFAHARDERSLTGSAIKKWHALLTRHQAVGRRDRHLRPPSRTSLSSESVSRSCPVPPQAARRSVSRRTRVEASSPSSHNPHRISSVSSVANTVLNSPDVPLENSPLLAPGDEPFHASMLFSFLGRARFRFGSVGGAVPAVLDPRPGFDDREIPLDRSQSLVPSAMRSAIFSGAPGNAVTE